MSRLNHQPLTAYWWTPPSDHSNDGPGESEALLYRDDGLSFNARKGRSPPAQRPRDVVRPTGPAPETSKEDRSDSFRIGLDHLALAVDIAESLHELKEQLDAGGVRNNGVQDDTLTGAKYIALYEPVGIAWELYAMPVPSATESSMGGMA